MNHNFSISWSEIVQLKESAELIGALDETVSVCRAGISQSRISHWLLQQGSDLSEQKKRAFYRWYQLEKTTPGNATLHPHRP